MELAEGPFLKTTPGIVDHIGQHSLYCNQGNQSGGNMAQTITQEEVYEALKTVYDPEIPVNVVDLGLVYDVQVNDKNNVFVQMTLTFPGCGMGPHIAQQAEWAIQDIEGVEEVQIELTFDPPWSPELISEEARAQLGI
jgi:FeS assembly SUF system protein